MSKELHDHQHDDPCTSLPVVSETSPAEGQLIIDSCGVTVYFPEQQRLVAINGKASRRALFDGSTIAEHVPFLAIESDAYDKSAAKPQLSFNYDFDGTADLTWVDAFILDGDRVRVTDVNFTVPPTTIKGKKLGKIRDLDPSARLSRGALNGSSRIAGVLDVSNASDFEGKDHGTHATKLKFGDQPPVDVADILAVTFDGRGKLPVIELDSPRGKRSIRLRGKGPWRAVLGNIPWQEMIGHEGHDHDDAGGKRLVHLEINWDLYDVDGKEIDGGRPVPIVMPSQARPITAGAHLTTTGRCGPTLDGSTRG